MDLYSAAERLSKPFVFHENNQGDELPIGAHGIIGDGHSCALIRVDGAIDWLCLPRFDSPSVFSALLDPVRGGLSAVTPAKRPFDALQRYDPDTNVLETLFRVHGQGAVRLTDYMPWTDDPRASIHEVHRRIECVDGAVDLSVVFDPRFEYAAEIPVMEIGDHGVLARGPSGQRMVAVVSQFGRSWRQRASGGVEGLLPLRAGERRWMVLSWDAPRPEPIAAYRPFEHLRATRNRWREWARRIQYDGPWRHHVMRSALLLKLLIYGPSGAMVAAPTTSLPEWVGGTRNWDYRYTWTRDTAMAIRAANLIGCVDEARDFFHFVRDTLAADAHDGLQVMYAVDGHVVPDERELNHLAGYRGSRPVRTGNGARDQLQFDTAGALLDAAFLYERYGGSITLRAWRNLAEVIEQVQVRWDKPDHGIWEPRGNPRHNVHSKLMSWLALDRGSKLAPLFGATAQHDQWRQAAAQIHADLCRRGLDPDSKHFVTAYDLNEPDAALLLLPIHHFLDPRDGRMVKTVQWVRERLGDGPFLHRYHMEDGVGGKEGAFVLCGFWLAEALALSGQVDEAQAVFVAHAEASNHLGLLAEELHPGSRELLGNFPQAFSHLGLVNAAARIDLALRLRDEGSRSVPHLLRRLA